ncbi:hypothetical protein QYE76_022403 [Lolium multiflorum]|uniref:Uncharacterized protein n=1 Tax=Lolium multiflorum TaxID=4521 RepID=A0AAD8RA86_LOLMU|nr:hypothetical protein QYE76_022391 [Lolium multiflorum]KAK1616886.1 hypothetical protein QYE76_022403 [Lolium multiflorum]
MSSLRTSSPRPYILLDAGDDTEGGGRPPLVRQLTYRSPRILLASPRSASPRIDEARQLGLPSPRIAEESPQAPLLDDRRITSRKAPFALTYRSFKRTNSLLASSSPRVASISPGIQSPRIDEESLLSQRIAEESLQAPPLLIEKKVTSSSKAPFVVLGFECLESTAFNGISTNLVVYLETVLHGSNLGSASNVASWFGTSYLTPIFGAIVADTYWGNYNTILVSLAVYLLGMLLVTFSAFLPPEVSSAFVSTKTLAFVGLYLVAIGSGGVRSSLLPFGAEQFDDTIAEDREDKASFFSWFYLCVDFGPIVSGLFIVWIQLNVSWGLGFAISTACIALACAAFLLATPMYKRSMPTGTPLKSLCQVLVAACRKASLKLPSDAALLYEASDDNKYDNCYQLPPRIAHTGEFRFLDKAAILSDLDVALVEGTSWKLCTVTQVEELKILLRLLPVWTTSIIFSAAYSQMNTTFIQQGSAMDMNIFSLSIPAASLSSFEVLCVLAWVVLYGKVIVPAIGAFYSGGNGEPSQLQRMGAGRVLMALSMALAAVVEKSRLASVARGELIGIAWQLPQYFFLAGGEVFCYIAQLEFFYGEAPDTMKSMCTSLALLTIALGSYLSSLIYAVISLFTATADSPGWIADDLNEGHLDYFFWIMAAISILNFLVYSAFAKNYKLKTVLS